MSPSGIYCIYFKCNNNKYYIGQTINFKIRFNRHLNDLKNNCHSNKELQNDYNIYGTPEIEIIEVVTEYSLLDDKEIFWIDTFDAYINGYNKTLGGKSTGFGENNPNALYSEEIYYEILKKLIYTDSTYLEIAKELKVSNRVVGTIGMLTSHSWLKEKYPEEYALLEAKKPIKLNSRKELHTEIFFELVYNDLRLVEVAEKFNVSTSTVERIAYGTACKYLKIEYSEEYNILMDKRGTRRVKAARKEDYPLIKSPEGIIYQITNARDFARKFGLQQSNLISLLNGKNKSHKGWTLCEIV